MAKPKGGPRRWVVGTHASTEALKTSSSQVVEVACLEGKKFDTELEKLLNKFKGKTKVRNKKYFNNLSEVHQGIAVGLSGQPQWEGPSGEPELLAMLDGLVDPHNVGAILRTSWLLKVNALFVPKNRSASLTPTVCKVACGGAEHIPLLETHFQSEIERLKKAGFWIYGLSEKADKTLPETEFANQSVIIIGAEGKGLRSSTLNLCDELVAIPQANDGASLNASVAFSLAAYEYRRSRPVNI